MCHQTETLVAALRNHDCRTANSTSAKRGFACRPLAQFDVVAPSAEMAEERLARRDVVRIRSNTSLGCRLS